MTDTSIEWTDFTWNPVTGCSKVSPGCAHCYAETVADRFWATQYRPMLNDGSGKTIDTIPTSHHDDYLANGLARSRRFTDVMCHEDRLDQPLRWKRPRRVFVNSMSDLFHEDVPDAFIHRVFMVMAKARQHTFQVLTKRAARMLDYLKTTNPLPNVWLGVSVENQHFADARIPLLLQTPAAIRFISAEPLLGPIRFDSPVLEADCEGNLDWVIVGGESGPQARPFDVAWARSIVEECKDCGVPVFVKQLGASPYLEGAHRQNNNGVGTHREHNALKLRDRKGGDPSEWPEDLRVRQMPEARA